MNEGTLKIYTSWVADENSENINVQILKCNHVQ